MSGGWVRPEDEDWRQAADYVAGMTDGFALETAFRLGLPESEAPRRTVAEN